MSNFPDKLRYAKSHEWVKKDGDIYSVGISDYAQEQLGDIVYVELPEVGDIIKKDDTLGELESSKAVSEINMPFNGEVIAINEDLDDSPEDINSDPYGTWIVKIKSDNESGYNNLLSAAEAKKELEDES